MLEPRRLAFRKITGWGSLLFAAALSSGPPQAAAQQDYDPNVHGLPALLEGSGFVQIPAGEFMRGSASGTPDEEPVRKIRITKGFEMGKFEVTQAQWDAVMRSAHPNRTGGQAEAPDTNPSYFNGATLPVESVSWSDVQEFIQALNARDPKHEYRLPTEAEWEYACKAGATDGQAQRLDDFAWYERNAGGQTHPVGQKKPNAWGLHDMLGNVWEWVQDPYAFDYYATSPDADPQGPEPGSYRVYRGGSWTRSAAYIRCGFRGFDFPHDGYYNVGFRLVRVPK